MHGGRIYKAPTKDVNCAHHFFGILIESTDGRSFCAYESRMRLTRHTDYALRILLQAAAEPDRRLSIAVVAEQQGIARNHAMKLVNELANAGLLATIRGRGGGFTLGDRRPRSASVTSSARPSPICARPIATTARLPAAAGSPGCSTPRPEPSLANWTSIPSPMPPPPRACRCGSPSGKQRPEPPKQSRPQHP